jgi:hypothetical protein
LFHPGNFNSIRFFCCNFLAHNSVALKQNKRSAVFHKNDTAKVKNAITPEAVTLLALVDNVLVVDDDDDDILAFLPPLDVSAAAPPLNCLRYGGL